MASRNFAASITDEAWKELGHVVEHLETAPAQSGQSIPFLVCAAVDFSGLFVKLEVLPRQGSKPLAIWLHTSRVRYVVDFRIVKAIESAGK